MLFCHAALWGFVKHYSEMKLKAIFLIALALSSVAIVGMILYANGTVQDIIRFRENTDFHSSAELSAYHSKPHDYKVKGSATQKPFIYLTETEQCLPENLASSSQIGDSETCNCDVIVLSFRVKCQDNNQDWERASWRTAAMCNSSYAASYSYSFPEP